MEGSGERTALVLAGGGARGAYEAGALSLLLPELERRGQRPTVYVGTSVGAINAAVLASTAHLPASDAADRLVELWGQLSKGDVIRPILRRAGPLAACLVPGVQREGRGLREPLPSRPQARPRGPRAALDAYHDRPQPPKRGSARARYSLTGGQGVNVKLAPRRGRARTYHVRCLPVGFPKWTAERHGRPQASWYVVTPAEGADGKPFVAIFDTRGVPVWWQKVAYLPIDAKLLPDGDLAWSRFTGTPFATSSAPYEERRLDGTRVRRIAACRGRRCCRAAPPHTTSSTSTRSSATAARSCSL